MAREFFDTHAHLDYPDFTPDLEVTVARAEAAGITRVITIGTDLESSRRAVALAERFPSVYAAVGWHPNHASEAPNDIRGLLRELAQHPKVVAIGETGLDYYRLPSTKGGSVDEDARYKERQAQVFAQQMEVAEELGLPCIIHQRQSFTAIVDQIRGSGRKVRGVFHCFGENAEELQAVLSLGFLVSYTGIVTFKNGERVRATLAATPMDKFMLETDCPFLAPVPYRGERCEPAYVAGIAQAVATVKGCTLEELSAATCATAKSFFRKLG